VSEPARPLRPIPTPVELPGAGGRRPYRSRPRGRLGRAELDQLWELYTLSDLTIADLAALVGRSPTTTSIYLRELRAAHGGVAWLRDLGGTR
jgi:hypothetical protein